LKIVWKKKPMVADGLARCSMLYTRLYSLQEFERTIAMAPIIIGTHAKLLNQHGQRRGVFGAVDSQNYEGLRLSEEMLRAIVVKSRIPICFNAAKNYTQSIQEMEEMLKRVFLTDVSINVVLVPAQARVEVAAMAVQKLPTVSTASSGYGSTIEPDTLTMATAHDGDVSFSYLANPNPYQSAKGSAISERSRYTSLERPAMGPGHKLRYSTGAIGSPRSGLPRIREKTTSNTVPADSDDRLILQLEGECRWFITSSTDKTRYPTGPKIVNVSLASGHLAYIPAGYTAICENVDLTASAIKPAIFLEIKISARQNWVEYLQEQLPKALARAHAADPEVFGRKLPVNMLCFSNNHSQQYNEVEMNNPEYQRLVAQREKQYQRKCFEAQATLMLRKLADHLDNE